MKRATMIVVAVAVFVAALAVLMAAIAVLVAVLDYGTYDGVDALEAIDEHFLVDVYGHAAAAVGQNAVGQNVGQLCSSVPPMHRDNCCVDKLMHGVPDPSCPVPPPNV